MSASPQERAGPLKATPPGTDAKVMEPRTMDTNLYWKLRGTYAERVSTLNGMDPQYLRAAILDAEYNDFLRANADFNNAEEDVHGHGKRLPYIGWFWRHLDFHTRRLPIGDCGEFIGFMANNKWGHDERVTTDEEFDAIMEIIDEAMRLGQEGGLVDEIHKRRNAKLDELWDVLQTMSMHSD